MRAGEIARGSYAPERRQFLRAKLLDIFRHGFRNKRTLFGYRTGLGDVTAETRIERAISGLR